MTTYSAPSGWAGAVQGNPGKVKAFEMVLYNPTDTDHPFKVDKLRRCIYELDNGNSLDLRLSDPADYDPKHSPKINNKAHITNSKNWESAYYGHQYDCSKSRLACKF